MQVEEKGFSLGANVVTQKWSPWQKKKEKKPGQPLHGAVERPLDLGPGGPRLPVGIWFSDQGF